MTPANVDAYNQGLAGSGALAPQGPFHLLDLFSLTRECGEECSVDGIHSEPALYDTAVQLVLSMLRVLREQS